jgi:hypothetical protein
MLLEFNKESKIINVSMQISWTDIENYIYEAMEELNQHLTDSAVNKLRGWGPSEKDKISIMTRIMENAVKYGEDITDSDFWTRELIDWLRVNVVIK